EIIVIWSGVERFLPFGILSELRVGRKRPTGPIRFEAGSHQSEQLIEKQGARPAVAYPVLHRERQCVVLDRRIAAEEREPDQGFVVLHFERRPELSANVCVGCYVIEMFSSSDAVLGECDRFGRPDSLMQGTINVDERGPQGLMPSNQVVQHIDQLVSIEWPPKAPHHEYVEIGPTCYVGFPTKALRSGRW